VGGQARSQSASWLPYAIGLGAFVYFGVLQFYGVNLGEEGATVYLFYRTAHGQQPYVDFISGYTPGYFYFHASLLRLFGEHLSVVRVPLVVVHALNVLLLARVTRSIAGGWWAAAASLAYAALLPIVETSECSFNVPYPAWYCICLFLAGYMTVRSALDAPNWWRWSLAGLLAAASFSFKPNSGLFQLAFCAIAALAPSVRQKPKVTVLLAAVVLGGMALVFRYHLMGVSGFVFVLPTVLGTIAWLEWAQVALRDPGEKHSPLVPFGAVLAGFLGGTLPWLAMWWWRLGIERLWREVLFIDTGYEQYFYVPYAWSWAKFGLLAVAAWLVWRLPASMIAARDRWAGGAMLGAAVAALGSYALLAPKPEGWEAAVVSAVQAQLYVLLPLSHMILALLGRNRASGEPPEGAEQRLLLVLGATCLFCSAYPRSDFFHVAYAAPLSFVVCVVVAEIFVRRWSVLFSGQAGRRVESVLAASVVVLLVVCALPQLRTWASVVGFFAGRGESLEWWDTERAAVLIRRDASGRRQANFARTARWLGAQSAKGQWLFTFPDLDLLGFLVGTPHPARIGYFKSGWPNHRVEAEVIDSLEQRPPRFVVTESPASLFFFDAPAYFFLLKDWIEKHYRVAEQIGSFQVWVSKDSSWVGLQPKDKLGNASASVPEVQTGSCNREAIQRIRQEQNASEIASWVRTWATAGFGSWDLGCSRLLLRVAGEIGDWSAGDALAARRLPRTSPLYDDWAGALWNLALRGVLLEFQLGAGEPQATSERTVLDWESILSWYGEEDDARVRLYLAWLIAASGNESAARAALERLPPQLAPVEALERAVLLSSLRGGAEAWFSLLPHMPKMPSLVPALFLRWAKRNQNAAVEVVRAGLRDENAAVREIAAYLAVPVGRRELCVDLQGPASRDARGEVRFAAAWAQKTLGCSEPCTSAAVSG
jgi:hypothetical protein